jgi:protein-disulfide isomerase
MRVAQIDALGMGAVRLGNLRTVIFPGRSISEKRDLMNLDMHTDRALILRRRGRALLAIALLLLGGALLLVARPSLAASNSGRVAATTTPTAAPTATPRPAATAAATATLTATGATTETSALDEPSGPPVDAPQVIAAQSSATLADLDEFNGIPVGFTDAGFPFMGDPNAPVTMVEYSDFLCPFCGRHVAETLPTLIDEYVQTGKLKLVFRDFPIPALHPTAPQGHQAAWCVGQDDPAAWWAMHEQLFGRQNEWNQVADPSDFLARVAAEVGTDPAVYDDCVTSGETIALVDAAIAEGQALGFSGTPSFSLFTQTLSDVYTVVGAYPVAYFQQYIDALLAGEEPPADPQAQAQQLPPWAQADLLAADPENPGRNLYGDITIGSDDAPLTIIEFSDMQCPACAQHANLVAPTIFEEYVETGKVRWVFKHRPLPMHPFAPLGAAATECAAEQGQFWELHDALFADQSAWAPSDAAWTSDDAEKEIISIAKELGLDGDSYSGCINSRQPMERVLLDVFDAEGVIGSTPSFVAIYNEQGTLLNGSRPVDEFSQVLDSLIEAAQ